MGPVTIQLPRRISEGNLFTFLVRMGKGNRADEILINFSELRFVIPDGVVALMTKVVHWIREGREVTFTGLRECQARTYLQRLDFFNLCGIELSEEFRRHDETGRFVTLKTVSYRPGSSAETIASSVADCVIGDEVETDADWEEGEPGSYGYIQYAVSELASNVLQHSGGAGFVAAQYYERRGQVNVGIADCGIGIRRSFQESDTGHGSPDLGDADAIELALSPFVSSKAGPAGAWSAYRENEGVGLAMLRELVLSAGGDLVVISGDAMLALQGNHNRLIKFPAGEGFQGTICAFRLQRANAGRFTKLLQEAKVNIGLADSGDYQGVFT